MNAFRRTLKWTFWIFVGLLGIGLLAGQLVDFRQDDAAIAQEFANQPTHPAVHRYTVKDGNNEPRTIRFMETSGVADTTCPTVVFIHGGSQLTLFFQRFFQRYNLAQPRPTGIR